jgi:hypothetical protein
MIDYRTWQEHADANPKMPKHLPKKPLETNNQGGFDAQNKEQTKRHKHADLITLPENVKGTNCGNCSFMILQGEKVGFCKHPEIQDWVTTRMCCAYWTHEGVKRSWEKNPEVA